MRSKLTFKQVYLTRLETSTSNRCFSFFFEHLRIFLQQQIQGGEDLFPTLPLSRHTLRKDDHHKYFKFKLSFAVPEYTSVLFAIFESCRYSRMGTKWWIAKDKQIACRTFKRNGLMNKRKPLLSGCADFLAESVLVFDLRGFVGNFLLTFHRTCILLHEQVPFLSDLKMNHKVLKQLK